MAQQQRLSRPPAFNQLISKFQPEPQKAAFLKGLYQFMHHRGESGVFDRLPTFQGQILDLVHFYKRVIQLGGSQQVTQKNKWSEVARMMEMPRVDNTTTSFILKAQYIRYLSALEQKQLFRKTAKRRMGGGNKPGLLSSQPNPMSRTVTGHNSGLINAFNSGEDRQLVWALNALASKSFGADGLEFLLDGAQDILDCLAIKLQSLPLLLVLPPAEICLVRKGSDEPDRKKRKSGWAWGWGWNEDDVLGTKLNGEEVVIERDPKAKETVLAILNILRNLSFIAANESAMAVHTKLLYQLVRALYARDSEVVMHSLDIFSNIGKHVALAGRPKGKDGSDRYQQITTGPPTPIARASPAAMPKYRIPGTAILRAPPVALGLSKTPRPKDDEERSPLSLLLPRIAHLLRSKQRTVACRAAEAIGRLCLVPQNELAVVMHHDKIFPRLVELLTPRITGFDALITDEDGITAPSVAAVQWQEAEAAAAAAEVQKFSNGYTERSLHTLLDEDLDHELRDLALEAVYHISEYGEKAKVKLGEHPACISALISVMVSALGKAESARMAAGALVNLSLAADNLPRFMPWESDLAMIAATDDSIGDLIANILHDAF